MKNTFALYRFNFGELSPLVCARGDLAKYSAGLKTLVNFIPLLQGPLRRRGGARFVAVSGNGDQPVGLAEFAFSETTAYILEFGDRYMRVFHQGAPALNNGQPYQIATPWRQADLFDQNGVCTLQWVQSGDVMYIVCPGQPPQKLSRHGHTDWRVEELQGWNTDEESRPNATAIALFRERLCLAYDQTVCMSQSGAFENFKLSAKMIPEVDVSSTTTINVNAPEPGMLEIVHPASFHYQVSFLPDEVQFEVLSPGRVIAKAKDAAAGLTRVGYSVVANPGGHTAIVDNVGGRIQVGDDVVSFDPRKGEISRDGAVDSGYIIRPASTAIAADDPIEINVYSEQMNKIAWLSAGDDLLVGTVGGQFIIGETTSVDPLGPENIKVAPKTNYGVSPLQAIQVGSVLLFAQRAGRKVREFVYDSVGESYHAMDVTVASEHITRGGLIDLVWQSEPYETLWAVRADGQLLGLSYAKEQEMNAWHRHILGGDGAVSQLAVGPAVHGGRDELWLSVRRQVGGQTVYYLETMDPGYEPGDDQAEAFFVDSGLTFRGSGLTTISGLDHLEGFEVAVLGDGGVQKRQIVQGGAITLQHPADVVQVGLPYISEMTTVNLEANLQEGTLQTRKKRFAKVTLRLVESLGGAVGRFPGPFNEVLEYRRGNDFMDGPPPLFSGDLTLNWPPGYEKDGVLTVRQEHPLPFILAAIYAETIIGGTD